MHDTATAAAGDLPEQPRLWGHPRQLWMLLGVTVWFTFAFYGFRAFLAPYIAQQFYAALSEAAAQRQADLLTSGFLALMYATPMVCGYVADKFLGEARSVALSFWLGTLGLLLMTWPTLPGFEIGMALFAWAAGLNIPLTVLIGRNYAEGDPRREGGYTLYYLAVNVGSFIAPLVCAAFIGQRFGFRWGFVTAAAGMLVAGIGFQWRQRRLKPLLPHGGDPRGPGAVVGVLVAIAVLVYPTALLLTYTAVLTWAMYVLMGALVLYFVFRCIQRGDRVQSRRYLALLLLFIPKTIFWAFSFQGVTSLNFFARDYVQAPFHYTLFQSANPLYILIFAPLLALLWPWLDKRGRDPSSPRKFGLAVLLVALSYGLMTVAIQHAGAHGKVAGWVLALCYLVQTIGELSLAPIGYGLVGQLAAPEDASLAMGGWFFGYAIAYQLSGWIASLTTPGDATHALGGIGDYALVYERLFWVGLAVAAVYLAAAPRIRRLMHGVR